MLQHLAGEEGLVLKIDEAYAIEMTNERTSSYMFKLSFCVVIGLFAKKLFELSAEVIGCWYFNL